MWELTTQMCHPPRVDLTDKWQETKAEWEQVCQWDITPPLETPHWHDITHMRIQPNPPHSPNPSSFNICVTLHAPCQPRPVASLLHWRRCPLYSAPWQWASMWANLPSPPLPLPAGTWFLLAAYQCECSLGLETRQGEMNGGGGYGHKKTLDKWRCGYERK